MLTIAVFFFSLWATHRRKEMTEFLMHMPADTVIFITMAVLGLAASLIGLKWLI
jgi:hypothetical protein